MKPTVIVVPHFRAMDEVFRPETLDRLAHVATIVWGRDGAMPQGEFEQALADATAVVFGSWSYGDAIERAGENLRAVLEVAGAHDHHSIGYQCCFERGIEVGSVAPAFGPAVAEMALGLTLAATRGITQNDRDFRTRTEEWLHAGNVDCHTLFNKRVGFVGCGGLSVALQRLLEPFDAEILGFDPFLPPRLFDQRGITRAELSQIVEACDVIYVLAAPTPTNQGLISRELLEALRPTQTLIVVSRASLVDFDALTDLATAGRFRLGIDVFPTEPLAHDHPLRDADNVVLSGHRAGAVPDALLSIGDIVVDDLEAIIGGAAHRRLQYLTPELLPALLQPSPASRR